MKSLRILKLVGKVFIGIIIWSFLAWYTIESFTPQPMPECAYSEYGCQGDNRWGQ